ncbi:S1 RNA-binding domain-containing protein [Candidatus Daviesbacteria bacterium]|nr:S1 RNA-binding domain-containing protein [Candidatus Daviesbacteria bacterium]
MADLLAKQDLKKLSISRGQELTGEVVGITESEVVFDLGTKSEGILPKKDFLDEQLKSLKVGDKLPVFVTLVENEAGQVLLSLRKATPKGMQNPKWDKFQAAFKEGKTFSGKGVEVNKGGLIVEVGEVRGFLPASQVSLSQASALDDLVGKDVTVTVIEIDPSQNRLIFSQKANVSEEVKEKLGKIKLGDKVTGKVAAVLPFGIFVTLSDGVEGLVHVSEISWEKVEDPAKLFKVGDEVSGQVISVDSNTNRVNLSIKQTKDDPFLAVANKYKKDDIVKGVVSKVSSIGVFITLDDSLEGLIHSSKIEQGTIYEVGQKITALVDNIDSLKRRIALVPFITTTKGLIYK